MNKYETYDKYVIRKPLFSYDILFNDQEETRNIEEVVKELIDNDTFVSSIYWSSPDLYALIISYRKKQLKEDKIPRLLHTLKKYVIRSSTRCTPYGTMAGVALQHIGNAPDTEPIARKARIDMDFLTEIKSHIENNENIRGKLRYKVNNTLAKIPGQYRYQEPVKTDTGEKHQLSSLEVNEYLERISDIAHFTKYSEIKKIFSENFEDAAISEFLDELIDIKFLISELQLTLTSDNISNIKNILNDLHTEGVSEAELYLQIFKEVEHCVSLIEQTPVSYLPFSEITQLKNLVQSIGIEKTHFFHVDLKHSSESNFEMNERTLRNINTSISILHALGTNNSAHKDLEEFKKNFSVKYESREVPLVEVLDSEFGLGFPAASQIGNFKGNALIEGVADRASSKKKESTFNLDFLLDLIEKDKKEIIYLENIDLKLDEEALTIQNFCIIGSPYEDCFFLQNIGTSGASSILGRFALMDEKIKDFCDEIHQKEKEISSEIIFAEVIYIPEKRIANITRRPKFSEYEIPIFANSSSDQEKQILLSDILISVKGAEIILRSKKLNKRVIPKLSNAHNFYNSESAAYKFLGVIQSQHQNNLNLNINYSKTKKRFFPRINYQNIVLHRASWFLYENDINLIKKAEKPLLELKKFLQKWEVPKFVVLVQGDNELFLDTTNDAYLSLLIDELKNNQNIQLSEWVQPIGGKKYNEQIVLPLENKRFKSSYSDTPELYKETLVQRSFAPGSEWLYLKMYCNSNISDYLLSNEIKPILDQLIDEGSIKSAFFIRYTDPHYHLRLRLNLHDKKSYAEVLQKLYNSLNPYFQDEMIWNLQIDSYQRELERYDPEYIEDTEVAFYHDSVLLLNLLDHESFVENEDIRLFAAVKNVDGWLSLFELSLQEKMDFCKAMENVFLKEFSSDLKTHINSKFRLLKDHLYSFFMTSEFEKEFNQRNLEIEKLKLCKEKLSSYIHMSINRWFSSEQRALEFMTYSFATKYYSRILSQIR
ncbi:hypothetical protein EG347_22750 (plasmid) [Chryseobacterium sp. G0186]|uniref:lantibiotic dehydratase n=1 Tax=Chryseobacterium sp. G0186 TaxID=2487064 RepID=UPI000F4F2B1C|nr:lantibiotic dehydratase [Chryseobacterium sp. G0186]AZA80376.1 hypothetical protein EG347_22750 [Chryseobacterium sp. G0186]